MSRLPWLVPGTVLFALLGLAVARPIGRALRVHPAIAVMLVVTAGIVPVATLTPLAAGVGGSGAGSGICNMTRIGLAPLSDVTDISEASLNIVLFIPFGAVLGLLPRSRWKGALLLASIAAPFVIEMAQLLVRSLHRACESADVVDNLTGLAVGFIVGTIVGVAVAEVGRALRARSGAGGHK